MADPESRSRRITDMTINDLIANLKQTKEGSGVMNEVKEVVDMLN